VGFDKWKAYILGRTDGAAKTPEWQEAETTVRAREVRALAREWGRKKTYLAPGHRRLRRSLPLRTGIEWARTMVCLMAMQGLGKPGVNMGCLQQGAPVDTSFYFPGTPKAACPAPWTAPACASACTSACRNCPP
jgi:trimethylamine-N-oxide reductase (cytochrome c)